MIIVPVDPAVLEAQPAEPHPIDTQRAWWPHCAECCTDPTCAWCWPSGVLAE